MIHNIVRLYICTINEDRIQVSNITLEEALDNSDYNTIKFNINVTFKKVLT